LNLITSPSRRTALLGWPLALASTVCFSIAIVISKYAIGPWQNPVTMLVARFVITMVLLGSTLGLAGAGRARMDRRGLVACLAAGLANGLTQLAFFSALPRLDASIGSMLFSLFPLAVLVLLALRGEPFTRQNVLRLGLGLAGVYLLIGPGGQADRWAVILVLLSIWGTAVHLVLLQWYLQGYDSRDVTFYVTSSMFTLIFVYWLAQGAPWQDPGWQGWLAVAVLAFVSTFVARLALVVAIRQIGSGQMALLMPLETLLTVMWSILFLGERLVPVQWAGGVLILSSALLAVRRLSRARPQPA
jgi:drug/metabolite transporter (DMT)-like permease